MERRKTALTLPKSALFSTDELREGLEKILGKPSYRHSIGALKQAIDDEIQSPVDAAVFWVSLFNALEEMM